AATPSRQTTVAADRFIGYPGPRAAGRPRAGNRTELRMFGGRVDHIDLQSLERLKLAAPARQVLETLLEQISSGVILAEAPTGRILLSNHRIAEIWRQPAGVDPSEWVGRFPDGRL